MYAQVAVDIPLFKTLTYAVPDALAGVVEAGHLVQAPFRNRAKTGLVMRVGADLDDPSIADKIRPINDLVDARPLLNSKGIAFLEFIADYYLAPIGQVVRLALPPFKRLEAMKHYRLVDQPDHAQAELDDGLRAAIERIGQADQPVAVKQLKEADTSMTFARLRRLEDDGWVDVTYEQEDASVKIRTERFYRVVDPAGDGKRTGSKQARILELFDDGEQLSRSDIRDVVDSPYSSLDGLVRRGFLEQWDDEVYRDPFEQEPVRHPEDHVLTEAQSAAVATIDEARRQNRFEGFVLHGVTGSGKTEVYVRAIRAELAAGHRAMVLLPEIALTPQFVAVFRGHFGQRIAVLHSGLSRAEKFDEWRRINRDEVDIVIGARSALFAPLNDVGIIVVDEEHDTSFKQGRGPRYHARDMALVRGKLEAARVVLGSATPSLESYHNAKHGRLTYLHLPERVADRPMPPVDLVDLRQQSKQQNNHRPGTSEVLSNELVTAVNATLRDQKQAILFLNRRGFSPCVLCQSCGHVFECKNCDVSLTYHRQQESLRCHHCDYALRMPETCPECAKQTINRRGTGTEKLEGHLRELFPRADIARLDRDTSGGKNLRRTIKAFRRGDIDLLVGTQMVTKGHDFPGVVTVGVVMADMSLNFPDFRAAERTFQLLTQVAGRAGRGDDAGRVYIQAFNPAHYSLKAAQNHDYADFSSRELKLRKELSFPPFGHLIAVKFEAASEARCIQAARDYASAARRVLRDDQTLGDNVFMLGPAMAPLSRLKGKSRWQILLKSHSRQAVRRLAIAMLNAVAHFEPNKSRHRDVRTIVDVDPVDML